MKSIVGEWRLESMNGCRLPILPCQSGAKRLLWRPNIG
jgi:hypothetical protein